MWLTCVCACVRSCVHFVAGDAQFDTLREWCQEHNQQPRHDADQYLPPVNTPFKVPLFCFVYFFNELFLSKLSAGLAVLCIDGFETLESRHPI